MYKNVQEVNQDKVTNNKNNNIDTYNDNENDEFVMPMHPMKK